MLLPKDLLMVQLNGILKNFITNPNKIKELYKTVKEKHNMPLDKAKRIITSNIVEQFDEFDLFCIAEAIESVDKEYKLLEKYYTEKEIITFRIKEYDDNTIKNPYVISNVVLVRESQYIGTIKASELRRLDNASKINYNENTQRVVKRIVHGDNIFYKIRINKKSITEIKNLMKLGVYFPDPITLNIPQDTDYYIEYDNDNKTLIIHNLSYFDILDGYHRFLAMRELIEEDDNFDYVMELRIAEWNESEAQQFIFQQDQKTKMSVTESKSFDQYSIVNRIIEKINTSKSEVAGHIGRSNCQIIWSDISAAIDKIFLMGINIDNKNSRQIIQSVSKKISDYMDLIYDSNMYKTDDKISYKDLYIILSVINKDISEDKFIDTVKLIMNETKDLAYAPSSTSRKFVSVVNKLLS